MTKQDADILLDVLPCRTQWEAYRESGAYLREASNVFNYECELGSIREWSLDDWRQNVGETKMLADQLVALDYGLFVNDNATDWVGSSSDWDEMLVAHPETWRAFVRNTGSEWNVLGYWMFVTPTDDWFARSCLGEYPEAKITLKTTKRLEDGLLNIYGPGMYCREDIRGHQRQTLGSRILLSFLYNIERLRTLGVCFDRICIPVMSKEGQSLAEGRFGLERMPEAISERYSAQMTWQRHGSQGTKLPALYFGALNEDLLARAGLAIE